ncbi:hypothetical protein R3P38DRAFT_3240327 [Favolaschia claudopus]|uniref:Uncharacterized protein n=1 Tax=Favolaschia claudopus TaxID=2862362 RepID=A0AAV9Z720_9AGAR
MPDNTTHEKNCVAAPKRRSSSSTRDSGEGKQAGASSSTPAQLAAMARYREKNQSTLRQKARERMARYVVHRKAHLISRSSLLKSSRYYRSESGGSRPRERARAADARYREGKADRLRTRQVDRRAMAYIEKHGMESWLGRDARREKIAASLHAHRQSKGQLNHP